MARENLRLGRFNILRTLFDELALGNDFEVNTFVMRRSNHDFVPLNQSDPVSQRHLEFQPRLDQ